MDRWLETGSRRYICSTVGGNSDRNSCICLLNRVSQRSCGVLGPDGGKIAIKSWPERAGQGRFMESVEEVSPVVFIYRERSKSSLLSCGRRGLPYREEATPRRYVQCEGSPGGSSMLSSGKLGESLGGLDGLPPGRATCTNLA